MQKKLGMVIVNYNDFKMTSRLLNNIKNYKCLDYIVVVDNNSTDDSFEKLKEFESNRITIIKNSSRHFSSGLNAGAKCLIKKVGECNIIFSNSDIIIKGEEDLKKLSSDINKDIVVVGPTIDEHGVINRGWHLPSTNKEILFNIALLSRYFKKKFLNYKESDYKDDITYVDVVSGCFFLVDSKFLVENDYFDENTFLYYEEQIFDTKVKNKNKKEIIDNKVTIIHDHSVSIDKSIKRVNKHKIMIKSQRYYCKAYQKGIILAGGSGTRLYPITEGISKQLMPIYDKPMIFYPLATLMLAGIKDILVITTPEDQAQFKKLLKDGKQFGINIDYVVQPSPDGLAQAFILGEEFIGDDTAAMILGDNIFYGNGFNQNLERAMKNAEEGYATIFGNQVKDPERFGIMELDKNNNVLSVEEKPQNPKSNYAITGLYFYPKGVSTKAKEITPSARGELEITTLNDMYLQDNLLKAELLGDEFTWFDTGTFDSQLDAANMIKSIETNKDKVICCPEQIAYYKNWITKEQLQERANLLKKNTYGEYLQKVVDEINSCLKAGKRYDISKLNIKTYTKDEVEEAVKMYEDVFEEGFPFFMAPDSDEGIVEIINKAFKTGKKYSPRIQRQKDGTPVVY